MFRIVDIEQIVSRAKASGRTRVEVEAPMLKNYGADAVVRQATWLSGVHKDKFYAWLHVTSEGEPFYTGWGRGDQAWVKNGGIAWEWFVRERLGGEYGVVVLVVSQVDLPPPSVPVITDKALGRRLLRRWFVVYGSWRRTVPAGCDHNCYAA